jgi:hypothetical protein
MHLSSGPNCGGGIIVTKGCMEKIHIENQSKYDGNSRELTVMTTNLSVVGSGPICTPAQGL